MYQRVLGRKLEWAWNNGANQEGIEVHPHAGDDRNAYYSRNEKALKFFFFTPITSPGSTDKVFTCRSLDIVAHEAGHAILDGLKPGWFSSFSPTQTGGLHEAFGDLTSIFLILSQLDLVEYIIAETKSDLHQKTILSALAEQFGISLGRPPALRNADNNLKLSEVDTSQVHAISVVFTGGVYDILADVFAANRDPRNRSDAEVLYESGQYIAGLTIRAIINAPETNATYADVVNQMINLATSDGHTDYVDFIKKHFEFREVIGNSAFKNLVDLSQLGLFSNRCGCCGTLQSPEYLK